MYAAYLPSKGAWARAAHACARGRLAPRQVGGGGAAFALSLCPCVTSASAGNAALDIVSSSSAAGRLADVAAGGGGGGGVALAFSLCSRVTSASAGNAELAMVSSSSFPGGAGRLVAAGGGGGAAFLALSLCPCVTSASAGNAALDRVSSSSFPGDVGGSAAGVAAVAGFFCGEVGRGGGLPGGVGKEERAWPAHRQAAPTASAAAAPRAGAASIAARGVCGKPTSRGSHTSGIAW